MSARRSRTHERISHLLVPLGVLGSALAAAVAKACRRDPRPMADLASIAL